jgi:hypothetical protein
MFTERLHTNTLTSLLLGLQQVLKMQPSRQVFVDVFAVWTMHSHMVNKESTKGIENINVLAH